MEETSQCKWIKKLNTIKSNKLPDILRPLTLRPRRTLYLSFFICKMGFFPLKDFEGITVQNYDDSFSARKIMIEASNISSTIIPPLRPRFVLQAPIKVLSTVKVSNRCKNLTMKAL